MTLKHIPEDAPLPPPTPEDLLAALQKYRDRSIATFLTILVGIVVEQHPEEMRESLSKVFDLTAIEEDTKNALAGMRQTWKAAQTCREKLIQLREDEKRLRERIEQLEFRAEELERRLPRPAVASPKLAVHR